MSRYNKYNIVKSTRQTRRGILERRDMSQAEHYDILKMHNPNYLERSRIATKIHVWKLGDKFYKLADTFYGDPRFWWVIAWYNGTPTEANLRLGAMIEIPLNLEEALKVLKA